jgi:hypothetical protein
VFRSCGYRHRMRRSDGIFGRLWVVLAAMASVVAASGCKREKPNANRDIQKNQRQYMNEMDEIAKKLEAEEAKKNEATKPAEKPAEEKPAQEAPAKAPDPAPEKKPG